MGQLMQMERGCGWAQPAGRAGASSRELAVTGAPPAPGLRRLPIPLRHEKPVLVSSQVEKRREFS